MLSSTDKRTLGKYQDACEHEFGSTSRRASRGRPPWMPSKTSQLVTEVVEQILQCPSAVRQNKHQSFTERDKHAQGRSFFSMTSITGLQGIEGMLNAGDRALCKGNG